MILYSDNKYHYSVCKIILSVHQKNYLIFISSDTNEIQNVTFLKNISKKRY